MSDLIFSNIKDFKEMNENSALLYLYENRVKTNIIYNIVLLFLSAIIISLPYIYVDIYVNASGFIRPISERTLVTASVSEFVDSVYVKEGMHLKKGDVIFTQRSQKNENQQKYRTKMVRKIDAKIKDLENIIKGLIPKKFQSDVICERYMYYLSQLQQIEATFEQNKIEWERNKVLFDMGLLSENEYNKYYFQYIEKKNELTTFKRNQKSIWQSELYTAQNERNEYDSEDYDLKIDKLLYDVRCPVSGTLEKFTGIYKGTNITSGQQVAVISPDGNLCIDTYVNPRDIAFIRLGMDVRIQVEALNYNEWGMLNGKVSDIASDLTDEGNGNYYYKVKCKIEKPYLVLKHTKRKAYVKKGMNVTAHFVVTRQSLLTMIYKNFDEWINPIQNK